MRVRKPWLGDEGDASVHPIFRPYSLGVKTNRDPWVYSSNHDTLAINIRGMIQAYNEAREKFVALCEGKPRDLWPNFDTVHGSDHKRISWTRGMKTDAERNKPLAFDQACLRVGMYRPFSKQWMYFDRRCNEMVYRIPRLFPTERHKNVVISSTGVADRKGYSALVTDHVPNMHLTDTGQCFPLFWYEKAEETNEPQGEMFSAAGSPDADGYVRRDAITDWALGAFRDHYGDAAISKEDIFWYVYGILHSPEYRQRFAADLKKMLPRILFAEDFRAFSDAGRQLGEWHLNYETVEPFPLTEEAKRLVMEPDDYLVTKMTFGKKDGKPDKSVIVYNSHLVLRDIPLEAYEYVVNGKPAIEWIMERYQVTVDKASGIKNDPNQWSEDPRYIVDLLMRVVRVSLESVRIVKGLPALKEHVV